MSSSPFTCWSRLPAPTRACVKRTFRALVDQFERARVLSVKAHIQRSIRNPAMHDDAIEAFFCLMVKYASEHNTSDVVVEPYRHGAKTVLLRTSRGEGSWGPHIVLTFQVASSAEQVVARLTNLKTYTCLYCGDVVTYGGEASVRNSNRKLGCGHCRCAFYCSRACQVANWPTHGLECRRARRRRKAKRKRFRRAVQRGADDDDGAGQIGS